MNTPAVNPVAPTLPSPAAPPEPDAVSPAEIHLGRALALIHRVLPRLDDLDRAQAVESALRQAAAELEAARACHQRAIADRGAAPPDGETLAVIAAAVAVVLGEGHRVVGVRAVTPSVTWVNAWAIEGRFQHYSSHKVR